MAADHPRTRSQTVGDYNCTGDNLARPIYARARVGDGRQAKGARMVSKEHRTSVKERIPLDTEVLSILAQILWDDGWAVSNIAQHLGEDESRVRSVLRIR